MDFSLTYCSETKQRTHLAVDIKKQNIIDKANQMEPHCFKELFKNIFEFKRG